MGLPVPVGKARRSRPGHSRRAQLGAFLTFVVGLAAILGGLAIALVSRAQPDLGSGFRVAATEVTTPVVAALRWPIDRLLDGGSVIRDHFRAVSRARELEATAAAGARATLRLARLEQENQRLRALLDLKAPVQQRVATATIVGSAPASFVRSALIPAGQDDGVMPGQPVRAIDGLVGRIVEAGANSARILLITDPQSRVPVTLSRSGEAALAAGDADGRLLVRTIDADRNPFRPGDLLVTSGVGGTFAPDIPVAVVVEVDSEGAIARPLARPERLREVVVETPYVTLPPPAGTAGTATAPGAP